MNSIEPEFQKYIKEKQNLTLRLDIINKCNLRCVMCHYSDKSFRQRPTKHIPLNEFKEYFRSVLPFTSEVVLSCGDEPLMSPHFQEIVHFISSSKKDIDISLCTNATLLNREIRETLITNGVTYLMMSMDGTSRETFENIRQGAKFSKVVANIKAMARLKRESNSPFPFLALNYVMMRSNIKETIAFLHMANELGINFVDFRHVVPSNFWNDKSEMLISSKSIFNFYRKKISETASKLNIQVVIPDRFNVEDEEVCDLPNINNILKDFRNVAPDQSGANEVIPKEFSKDFVSRAPFNADNSFPYKSYCERPFTEIFVRNQDEILPCPWHKNILGRISDGKPLAETFFGDNFSRLRKTMVEGVLDTGCEGCPVKQDFLPTKKI